MQSPDGSHDAVVTSFQGYCEAACPGCPSCPLGFARMSLLNTSPQHMPPMRLWKKERFVSAEIGCKRAASLWLDSDKKGVELYLTLASVRC